MVTKRGFTLAETLITLTIVGLIAVFVIPTITKVTPNQNKVLFKKAYSSLEKAINDLSNDEADYPTTAGTDSNSNNILTIGFSNTATGNAPPASTDKFCYALSQEMNTTGNVAPATMCPIGAPNIGTFTTTDGIVWSMPTPTVSASYFVPTNPDPAKYLYIKVDVNGTKAPNCGDTGNSSGFTACTAGQTPDKFYIGVRYDGKIMVNDPNAVAILTNPTVNQ